MTEFEFFIVEDSIHAHLYPPSFVLLNRPMKAYFHLIQINVHELFAVRADLGDLPIEIDRIVAAGTASNDYSNDLRFLLHVEISFRILPKRPAFLSFGWILHP